ncbi:MAG TPA: GNAT family N-acetyltransferase [Steroidobacteraceae bacterium]|nr:GNAT family N-acetyltransferase [Steroidobacteraceae bacterium]
MIPTQCRSVTVDDSTELDIAAVSVIYGHWVRHGLGSFELEPPAEDEMRRRRESVLREGFPYLVARTDEGGVVGFAYGHLYRTRGAYRYACEDSIYVAPQAVGMGVGRLLLGTLIERCEQRGSRVMIAVIGDGANHASIRLHLAFGFERVGLLPAVGWKHARWVDSVLMSRPLGEGSRTAPDTPAM